MKRHLLLKCAVVLMATVCGAGAFDFTRLVGNWDGRRKELENGVGAYSNVDLIARPRSDGGLLIVEKGKWPALGRYTWRHSFHENGTYSAIAKSSTGIIFATTSGTWKEVGDTVVISGENSNLSGTAPFKGSLRRDSKNKLVYAGKSGTLRVVITGKRR